MLQGLAVLLTCQLVGEVVAQALEIPLPGPVIGLVLLFVVLLIRGGIPEPVERVSAGLLENLSLLFVPAGVGVIVHLSRVADEWVSISIALVVSTLLTVAVTGLLMKYLALLRRTENKGSGKGSGQ